MAPLTRQRAQPDGTPTDIMIEYYKQRASAGLIITEATSISPYSYGYYRSPGIHTESQKQAWKKIVDEVHAKSGKIFLQIWHVGRVSHPWLQPDGETPVAPSAIEFEGYVHTPDGKFKIPVPRALEISEIQEIVNQFKEAAKNAKEAGFDGVEIHGANGYLIDQFLRDGANQRTDIYGGSIENRTRFLLEVINAVSEVYDQKQIGLRLSPRNNFNGNFDSDPISHFSYIVEQLNQFDLAYLHLLDPRDGYPMPLQAEVERAAPILRKIYKGTLMLNGAYDLESSNQELKNNEADLIAFGKLFIANPDLPKRFEIGAELNAPDFNTFYTHEEKGYTDYPSL